MRRNLLITTAAAALAAGTMFAAAQGVQKQAPGAAAEPGVQGQMPQGQDKSKGKAQSKQPTTQGQGGQAQGQQSQEKGPEKGKVQSKEPRTQGQGGQTEGQQGQEKGKAQSKERDRTDGQRDGQTTQPKQSQSPREGQKGAEGKGAAGGSGSVTLNTEQRTKIRTTVLQGSNAPRATNVNFNVSVGTVVPRSVRVVAVPTVLIDLHPEWRGHMYFIVDERIIIVDSNYRIIAVLVV